MILIIFITSKIEKNNRHADTLTNNLSAFVKLKHSHKIDGPDTIDHITTQPCLGNPSVWI